MDRFIQVTNGDRDIRKLMKALRSGYTLKLDKVYIKHIQRDDFKVWIDDEVKQVKKAHWVRNFLKRDYLQQEVYQNLI